jgi:sialic acid synthase SpsE
MKKPYLILEVGINHGGSFDLAKKIVIQACNTNADAIKLQYFQPSDLYKPGSLKYKSLYKLLLSDSHFFELRKIVKKKQKDFGCTAFSAKGFDFLKKLNPDFYKVASMDNINLDLLNHVAKFKSKTIISLGMAKIKNIKSIIKIFKENKNLYFLHCISNYPTRHKDLNLSNLVHLKKRINLDVGYSDHSLGLEGIKMAYDLGANVIEKHFTDNKNRQGLDNKISADKYDIDNFYKYINSRIIQYGNYIYSESSIRPDYKNEKKFRRKIKILIDSKYHYVRK